MAILLILLRITHVMGAAAWVGALVSLTFFIIPGAVRAAPGSARFFAHLSEHTRATAYLRGSALATVASGLLLFWWAQAASHGIFTSTRPGMAYAVGGAAALIAIAFSLRPGGIRAAMAPQPADERTVARTDDQAAPLDVPVDQPGLHASLARVQFDLRASLALASVAAVAMAVARYL
jgi:hypothetical protein